MKARRLHDWAVSPSEAVAIQKKLKAGLNPASPFRSLSDIRTVAGCDLSVDKASGILFGGAIVYAFPSLKEIERTSVRAKAAFPYVPGLLSFREGPLLVQVLESLKNEPDVLIFDGQGIAHPRGLGIAAHIGLLFDKPSIGCAKSRLFGRFREPGAPKGARSPLLDDAGKTIGAALRTRENCNPIFISPGHRMDLETAVGIVMACAGPYRVPQPTREADRYVEDQKKYR